MEPRPTDQARTVPEEDILPAEENAVSWLGPGITGTVAFNILFALWVLIRPAPTGTVTSVDDLLQVIGPVLGVSYFLFAGWPGVRRTVTRLRTPGRSVHDLSAILLILGVTGFPFGQAIWSYFELVRHQPTPFPSLADAGFLSAYPFLFLGIVLLPVRRASAAARARTAFDSLLIMTGIVTFSWYFIVGPTFLQGGETGLGKVVGTAYPACDLILVFSLLILTAQKADARLRPVRWLLSSGLVTIVVTDSIFDYQTLHDVYHTGGLVDVGWPLGYMLICLGALATNRALTAPGNAATGDKRSTFSRHTFFSSPLVRSLLPYLLVPLVGGLVLYTVQIQGDGNLDPGVYVGAVLLFGMLLARQILTIVDNEQLHQSTRAYAAELHAMQQELQANNESLIEANRRLEGLATTDPLTCLPNHRALVLSLDHELERSHRYQRPFSVLFLDIDHFKTLNDTYGHAIGDAALREFAVLVRESLRGVDLLGRWGGEEFVAILPETDGSGAMETAERIRARVSAHTLPVASGVRLTCSIGVAAFPADGHDRDLLLDLADAAMYAAKRLGRNQVRLTSDAAVTALQHEQGIAGTREEAALAGTVEALASLVQARDQYTGRHVHEVALLSESLGRSLGLGSADLHALRLAGQLHDVGKVAIPDAVLQKPGRLTEEEWGLMRTHPVVGADVVNRVPGLRMLSEIIRSHHERWDGTGYPDGLVAEQIPLGARIVAVADAFLAMTGERPYQQARTTEAALVELQRCAGTQFDTAVVVALLNVIGHREAGESEAGAGTVVTASAAQSSRR